MAEFTDTLTDKHIAFIEKQPVYFTATAAADGRINLEQLLAPAKPDQGVWPMFAQPLINNTLQAAISNFMVRPLKAPWPWKWR